MDNKVISATAIALQANVPLLLWGEPGIGKTRVVESLGKHLGLDPVVTVIASIHDPTDFSGLPFFDRERGVAVYAAPDFVTPLVEAEKGILFLDEFTTAPPAIEAACLRIVLEGAVGNHVLPPEVRRVAAANPPEIAVNGRELSLPMSNRFVHIEFDIPSGYYIQGMLQGFPPPEVPKVPPDWKEKYLGKARGMIASFLAARPSLLKAPPKDPPFRGWPSPRTWYDFAAPLLAACEAAGANEDVEALLLSGCVGEGAAFEFLEWRRNLDLPTPEECIRNPNIELPDRDDKLLAMLVGVVNYVRERMNPETWSAAWTILARAAEDRPDLAALPARLLFDTKKQYEGEYTTPAFQKAMKSFVNVFKEMPKEGG